jgi:uncharacterized protein YndB with AHSA1/START domain
LEEREGQPALRFERVLRHPPERVWDALTDPDRQFGWHPTPARFELEVGGRVEYLEGGFAGPGVGEVTAVEPPRLLAYTWVGSEPDQLRWELRPHDEGCLLTLAHTFSERNSAANFGAGWHICLDALPEALAGSTERPPAGQDQPRWRQLNAGYESRFGIAPAAAVNPGDARATE